MRTSPRLSALAALACLLAPAASAASAGTVDVAIVAAASTSATDPRFTDPRDRLLASGYFASVDIVDAYSTTPSLAQLQAYDAVITWTNFDYQDPVALGNVLADYVDAGGGVVVAVFANASTGANRYLQGRWLAGYEVIETPSDVQSGSATLGTVHVPGHPILAGVNSFSGGSSSFRPQSTTLVPGAALLAEWSDGRVLVALHPTIPGRVELGMYPPSDSVSASFWDTSTDGAVLLSNALLYAAEPSGLGTPFCFGDGSGTVCPCGNLGAAGEGCGNSTGSGALLASTGIPSVGADSVVLTGSGMPATAPALYFQGTSALPSGLLFGDGLRCAGGTIVRIGTVGSVGGESSYPGPGDASVSVRGQLPPGGGLRVYQLWYRNVSGPCGFGYNLSNGLQLDWGL